MAKITEYPEASSFDQGDVILKDGVNGTKKMTVDNLMQNLVPPVDATLTQQGKPADAKKVGDELTDLKSAIDVLEQTTVVNDLSGDVITFDDAIGGTHPLSLSSTVVPTRSGSGTPTPTNPRAISPVTGGNLVISPTLDAQDGTTYPISWQSTAGNVYGGTIDIVTGVLTVNTVCVTITSDMTIETYDYNGKHGVNIASVLPYNENRAPGICSHSDKLGQYPVAQSANSIWVGVNNSYVYWIGILDELGISTIEQFKTWLDTQTVQIVYTSNRTQNIHTYQLTPIEITLLTGSNNVWTDFGVTSISYLSNTKDYVEKYCKDFASEEYVYDTPEAFATYQFESGTLSSTGVRGPSNSRIYTPDFFYVHAGDLVLFDNSTNTKMQFIIAYYHDNNNTMVYDSMSDWHTSDTAVEHDGYIRLVVGTSDWSDISSDDYDDIAAMVRLQRHIKTTVDVLDKVCANDAYAKMYSYDSIVAEYADLFPTSGKADSFIFFTDPHLLRSGDAGKMDRMYKFTGVIGEFYHRTSTRFVLCGGDWLEWTDTPKLASYKLNTMQGRMKELFGDNYYPIIGNHDTNYQGTEEGGITTLSNDALINLMFPMQSRAYYSFKGQNARFYILDSGLDTIHNVNEYELEQIDWLADELIEKDDTYNVIAMHILWTLPSSTGITSFASALNDLIGAYNSHSTVTISGTTYDFTGCTGKIGFVLGGHIHTDRDDDSYNVPFIASIYGRGTDTIGETPSGDLILVDWTNSKVDFVRFGSGESRTIDI